jgi:hypothetical protein
MNPDNTVHKLQQISDGIAQVQEKLTQLRTIYNQLTDFFPGGKKSFRSLNDCLCKLKGACSVFKIRPVLIGQAGISIFLALMSIYLTWSTSPLPQAGRQLKVTGLVNIDFNEIGIFVAIGFALLSILLSVYLTRKEEIVNKADRIRENIEKFQHFLAEQEVERLAAAEMLRMWKNYSSLLEEIESVDVNLAHLIDAETDHLRLKAMEKKQNSQMPAVSIQSRIPGKMLQTEIFTLMLQAELLGTEFALSFPEDFSEKYNDLVPFTTLRTVRPLTLSIHPSMKEVVHGAFNRTKEYVSSKGLNREFVCSTRIQIENNQSNKPLHFVRICYWEEQVLELPEVISFIEQMEMYGILGLWLDPKEVRLEESMCKPGTEEGDVFCVRMFSPKGEKSCSTYSDECDFIYLGTAAIQGYRNPTFCEIDSQESKVLKYSGIVKGLFEKHKNKFWFAKEIAWLKALEKSRGKCQMTPEGVLSYMVKNSGFRFFTKYDQSRKERLV